MIEHFYKSIEGCFTFAEFYAYVAHEPFAHPSWHGVEVGALWGQSGACLGVELLNAQETRETVGIYTKIHLDLIEQSAHGATIMRNLEPLGVGHPVGVLSPMSSLHASTLYPDGSLAFVMLDADHTLAAVRADIAAWWPKIRRGGILAGHDFSHYYPGVMRAALEAFPRLNVWAGSLWPDETVHGKRRDDAENDLRARSATGEPVDFHPVWWVRKLGKEV